MAIEGEVYLGPYGIESEEELISNYAKEVVKSFEEFGRSERTLGGTLKTDITSRKYTFNISYDYIDQDILNIIYEKYGLNVAMSLRMYISESDYFKSFTGNCPIVKISPFSHTDFRTGFPTKIYRGTSLVFLEI